MNELQKLKNLFNLYAKSRNKEEREKIKEVMQNTLESINQNCIVSDLDIDRINFKINYNIIPKYLNKKIEGYFSFSNATNKYYINGLHFSA
jgi:hypothetical protein